MGILERIELVKGEQTLHRTYLIQRINENAKNKNALYHSGK